MMMGGVIEWWHKICIFYSGIIVLEDFIWGRLIYHGYNEQVSFSDFWWRLYDGGIMEWVFGKLGLPFLGKNTWYGGMIQFRGLMIGIFFEEFSLPYMEIILFPKELMVWLYFSRDWWSHNLVGIDGTCYWMSTGVDDCPIVKYRDC